MVIAKSSGLLPFDSDSNLVAQGCQSAKVITKEHRFEKNEMLGHLNDDISTTVSAKAPQKSSHGDQSLQVS